MSDGNCQSVVLEPPCVKKIKKDDQNENGVAESVLELKDFVPSKILNNNTNRKTVCIQGNFKDRSGVALVILEKNAFREEELDSKGYFSDESGLKTYFQNDIYGNFECYPNPSINGNVMHSFPNPNKFPERFKAWANLVGYNLETLTDYEIYKKKRICDIHFTDEHRNRFKRLNALAMPTLYLPGVKTTIIYPATEKHIAKFSQQELHIIQETPECYEKLTLPHLEKEQFNLQWVYNILEGKSEQDRIVHDNKCGKEGFVLVPDLKWDGLTKETLYLLAIVRQKGIKSLRDLDASHLPLLKRIRDEGKKAIFDKYKVRGSQLRIYFHYQPSFYHLHIHFTYLRHEAPGIYAEKSHLLDTVINNIEMMSDYYKKATLPFTIREMDTLFNVYETNGYVQKIKSDDIELIDK